MKDLFIWIITVLLVIVLIAAFEGWIFSLLWNWIVPLFWANAPVLTVWQGFGILFLLNLIFGNFNKNK